MASLVYKIGWYKPQLYFYLLSRKLVLLNLDTSQQSLSQRWNSSHLIHLEQHRSTMYTFWNQMDDLICRYQRKVLLRDTWLSSDWRQLGRKESDILGSIFVQCLKQTTNIKYLSTSSPNLYSDTNHQAKSQLVLDNTSNSLLSQVLLLSC